MRASERRLLERRWIESRSAICAVCGRMGTRVGEQNSKPVVDVLCTGCFEDAPMEFKLTKAQDVFRDAVRAGCHPRIAARRAGFLIERTTRGG